MSDDFDWYGEDVAIPVQDAVAVYRNVRGNIAIRQKGDWHGYEEDVVIEIVPDRAGQLAAAIFAIAEEMGAVTKPATTLALPAPADRTAATRQRRYRERKRDRVTVTSGGAEGVTRRDGSDATAGDCDATVLGKGLLL